MARGASSAASCAATRRRSQRPFRRGQRQNAGGIVGRMSIDGVVLVHGGYHGAWCWDAVVALLDRPCAAVDLPGRGARPAVGQLVTLASCVDAVLADAAFLAAHARCVPEPNGLFLQGVSGYGSGVAATYVRCARDVAVPAALADAMIANLRPTEVRDLDSDHDAMLSHPKDVAALLNEIAARL